MRVNNMNEDAISNEEMTKLTSILPFMSIQNVTGILRFVKGLYKAQKEGKEYLDTEELQALAIKSFGTSILDKINWSGNTEEKIKGLAKYLGVPEGKADDLMSVLSIFVGD